MKGDEVAVARGLRFALKLWCALYMSCTLIPHKCLGLRSVGLVIEKLPDSP